MNFNAVIFDMDGVVTKTAAVHAAAWKRMFDEYLRGLAATDHEVFREFTHDDYLAFVDGRPRYAGVRTFLSARGISLPYGDPSDPQEVETICGLGNRKNWFFHKVLEEDGVEVYDSTIQLIHQLRTRRVKVGLATSSKNATVVLEKARIADLFETCVDGIVSAELGLRGKPQPDIFLAACRNLKVHPSRSVVVEDAVSGVEAGARGHFGLVIGVARENNAEALRRSGADLVLTDLAETSLQAIDDWFLHGTRTHSTPLVTVRTL